MLVGEGPAYLSFHGANALLTLLNDPSPEIRSYAVQGLWKIVNYQWYEIADHLPQLEQLREDERIVDKELIALTVSVVYYHLNEVNEAINYALEAKSKFDITSQTEYVQSILSYCIDQYASVRCYNYVQDLLVKNAPRNPHSFIDDVPERPILSSHSPRTSDDYVDIEEEELSSTNNNSPRSDDQDDEMGDYDEDMGERETAVQAVLTPIYMPVDARLEGVVNRLIDKCVADKKHKQAIGICIETKRLDALEKVIRCSDNITELLLYVTRCASSLLADECRDWRRDLLEMTVKIFTELAAPDYLEMARCLIALGEAKSLADLLVSLASTNFPLAVQLTLDVFGSSNQRFRSDVNNCLQQERKRLMGVDLSMEIEEEEEEAESPAEGDTCPSSPENEEVSRIDTLISALSGAIVVNMSMQFLIRHNHADLYLLKHMKDHARNMLCHSAVVIANGFMHCGTTCDQFLRDNLEWLGNATNWARFTATASLGVIHRFHEKEALRLMDAYLPKQTTARSPYAEGGGLYALGLIFANHGSGEMIKYVEDAVNGSTNPVVKHGGCLGLGLLALGTNNRHVLSVMSELLSMNDAVVGEAVAIGMGMVMMGSRSRSVMADLIAQAEETPHEKIARGVSIGIALLCFNLRDGCIRTLLTLSKHNNPFLRRAAMYGIGMAWIGTGQNEAVRNLLNFAVGDVSDDVRRAAVESLGFVLYKQRDERIISIISLLIESYNPHVRYGSAMALGIAFAGTGNLNALKLLENLTRDPLTFVRMGTFMAQAMITANQPEAVCPYAKVVRVQLSKVITDKHEEIMAKYGAIVAQGIIDACGRNASVSLESPSTGLNCPQGAAGMLIFLHFWYWFPLIHMLSLAFKPSALICVTEKLQTPDIEILSSLPSSHFSYPASLAEQRRGIDKREKVETAVLSSRRGGRQSKTARMKHAKESTATPAPTAPSPSVESTETQQQRAAPPTTATTAEPQAQDKEKQPTEPSLRLVKLRNLAVVRKGQCSSIIFPSSSRFKPVLFGLGRTGNTLSRAGMIVVVDQKPDSGTFKLMRMIKSSSLPKEDAKEPSPPEPFEYTEAPQEPAGKK